MGSFLILDLQDEDQLCTYRVAHISNVGSVGFTKCDRRTVQPTVLLTENIGWRKSACTQTLLYLLHTDHLVIPFLYHLETKTCPERLEMTPNYNCTPLLALPEVTSSH